MYPTTQRLQWSESMLENCLPVEEKRVELTKFHLKKIPCFAICHAEKNDYQTLCRPCQPGMPYKNVRSLTRSPICDSWKEPKLSPSANQQNFMQPWLEGIWDRTANFSSSNKKIQSEVTNGCCEKKWCISTCNIFGRKALTACPTHLAFTCRNAPELQVHPWWKGPQVVQNCQWFSNNKHKTQWKNNKSRNLQAYKCLSWKIVSRKSANLHNYWHELPSFHQKQSFSVWFLLSYSSLSGNGMPIATVIWALKGLPCKANRFAKASATKPPNKDPKVAMTSGLVEPCLDLTVPSNQALRALPLRRLNWKKWTVSK